MDSIYSLWRKRLYQIFLPLSKRLTSAALMGSYLLMGLGVLALYGCYQTYSNTATPQQENLIADSFCFPVGPPNAKGYYNAQKFTQNDHLGEDWNGVGGKNTDLGDSIYAVANGEVMLSERADGGWGNVVIIQHTLSNGSQVESLYGHCDTMFVHQGEWVKKGTPIATIGTAFGRYYAHLHFEIRDSIGMGVRWGYHPDTTGYVNPTAFILQHNNH